MITTYKLPYPSNRDLFILQCLQRQDEIEVVKDKINNCSLLDILQDVCKALDLDLKKVIMKGRKREYVYCRKIFIYVACKLTSHSLKDIARMCSSSSDHSNVIHHRDDVEQMLEIKDSSFMPFWDTYLKNSLIFKP